MGNTITEKRTTLAQVRKLARRLVHKSAEIVLDKLAPKADAKQELWAEKRLGTAERERLREEQKAAGDVFGRLRKAARFAVDVNGGYPSLDQLREATLAAEQYIERAEEISALFERGKKIDSQTSRHQVKVLKPLGYANLVACSGDSLAEVAEKLSSGRFDR